MRTSLFVKDQTTIAVERYPDGAAILVNEDGDHFHTATIHLRNSGDADRLIVALTEARTHLAARTVRAGDVEAGMRVLLPGDTWPHDVRSVTFGNRLFRGTVLVRTNAAVRSFPVDQQLVLVEQHELDDLLAVRCRHTECFSDDGHWDGCTHETTVYAGLTKEAFPPMDAASDPKVAS